MKNKLAVVALGGNALLRGDEAGIFQRQFTAGIMAPKVQTCLNFIKSGGKMAVITEAFKLADTKYGSKITMEYEDDRR